MAAELILAAIVVWKIKQSGEHKKQDNAKDNR
jgi:hypothetical protein